MTPLQVREARLLLGWSKRKLAVRCGVPHPVVSLYEATGHVQPSKYARTNPVDRVAVMRATLEKAGVTFIEENGGGPGVRLRGERC